MKQLMLVTLFVLMCSAYGFGQNGSQKVFNDRDECLEALETGNYKVYQSIFTNNKARAYGGVKFNLPVSQCVKMDVAGGVGANAKYVVQDSTISFTRKNGRVYRTDCGNTVYEIVDIPAPQEPKCKNKNLTLQQARDAGLIVTEDGRCELPVAEVPKCKNKNLTLQQARDAGLIVTEDGRCEQPIVEVAQCRNIDMTITDAKAEGYKIDKKGNCKKGWSKKKKAIVWGGVGCGAGILISGIITKNFNPLCGIPLGTNPKKRQTRSQIPDRPGTPGNPGTTLPTGNNGPVGSTTVNPTNGIPTRPRRNFAETTNTPNGATTPVQQNTSTVCSGQLIKLDGVLQCVNGN